MSRFILIAFGLLTLAACESNKAVDPVYDEVLTLTNQVGGTHYRTLIEGERWWQTFNTQLYEVNPKTGVTLMRMPLGDAGVVGPAVDLAAFDAYLLVVIEGDGVLAIDKSIMPSPEAVVHRWGRSSMGIAPRNISIVGNEVFVTGDGGVAKIDPINGGPAQRVLTVQDRCTSVARSEAGLVTCVGRRVLRLGDASYIGSATQLANLNDDSGRLAFVRQLENAALVGLMTPGVREVNAQTASVPVQGDVLSMRVEDGLIWIVTAERITAFRPTDSTLEPAVRFDVRGARDVGILKDNYLAVAGTFGRAIYRIARDEAGPGDTFLRAEREAGRLTFAQSDGRSVLAGSEEGMWLYRIGSDASLTGQNVSTPAISKQSVTLVNGRAQITPGGRAVHITTGEGNGFEVNEAAGARYHCVEAIEGHVWMGHDRGVTVYRNEPRIPYKHPETGEMVMPPPRLDRIRLAGPVKYIFPVVVGDGAAIVSEFGGFAEVRYIRELVKPGEDAKTRRQRRIHEREQLDAIPTQGTEPYWGETSGWKSLDDDPRRPDMR